MNSQLKKPVLFFSSLTHGGGRTFAETYAESLREADITLSTLYNNEFTKTLAKRLKLKSSSICNPRLLLDPRTLVLSNSQVCAAIAALLYPGRHHYVTHGYANGLPYASAWRRIAWSLQVNLPGTRVIACGDSERDAIAKLCLDKRRISLIRNGLPPKILHNSAPGSTPRQEAAPVAHFAYIGRITYQKGLDLLLQALELPILRHTKIKVSIIGNYQEKELEYCEKIRKLISNSPATVEVLPPQTIDATFFQKFSAIVSPSRFEGLPYTILEAAHAGTPILLSDCPGNSDIAPDSRYAYIFKSNDITSLANTLADFLDSSSEDVTARVEMMRKRVATEFSATTFRNEYLELLR